MIQFNAIPKDFKRIEFGDIETHVAVSCPGTKATTDLGFSVLSKLDY
jgi:hypothetical protein